MGHQHHLSKRKSTERALDHIRSEMLRGKNIRVETPLSRLDEVERALKSIHLDTYHFFDIKKQYVSFVGRSCLNSNKINLIYRKNGRRYEPFEPDENTGQGKLTIQWSYVKEPESEGDQLL